MSSAAQIEQQENMPPLPESAMEVPSQQLIADNSTGALVSTNNDTPNTKRSSYTKRTPTKRLTFTERAQRESEELVRNMGGSLELEGGRRTRSSTRGTPIRNQTSIETPPTKRTRKAADKDGSTTPSSKAQGRGRGRKLLSGNVDTILTSSTTAIDTAMIIDSVNINTNQNNQDKSLNIAVEIKKQQNDVDKEDVAIMVSSDEHITSINLEEEKPQVDDVKNREATPLTDTAITMDTDLPGDKLIIEIDNKETNFSNNGQEDNKEDDVKSKDIVSEVVAVLGSKNDKIISDVAIAETEMVKKLDENKDMKDNITNENNFVKEFEEVNEQESNVELSENDGDYSKDLKLIEEKCEETKNVDTNSKDNEEILSTTKENDASTEVIDDIKQELPVSNSTDQSCLLDAKKIADIDSKNAMILSSNSLHEDEKLIATRSCN